MSKTSGRKIRIHFNLDLETYNKVEFLSRLMGISKSEVIRRSVKKYYDEISIKLTAQ